MNNRLLTIAWILLLTGPVLAQPNTKPSKVTIDENHVLEIDGKKVFSIGFTLPPAPDAKAWNGKGALEEFRDAGAIFIRTGPSFEQEWDADWIAKEKAYHTAAAKVGMYCLPWLKELSAVNDGDKKTESRLREIVRMFKDSPGLGCWKGEDEPQWGEMNSRGKKTAPPLVNAYKIIHEEDGNHPVWIVQAPRGTIEQLKPYNATYDIGGVDVYPISYPPGTHVVKDEPNKDISMVGDYTQKMLKVVENKKPIWFTLQVAWSGVTKPGKTLRFPTFHEERFMTYQAIINGARGLIYFGGNLPVTLNPEDAKLGWNWTFWRKVLRPVIEEVGTNSPLAPALVAPDSKLPIKAKGEGIELLVREVGKDIYILACSREPRKTAEVEFVGLPKECGEAEVMYESPRKVTAKDGSFKDWFAPFEVHVYKFSRK